MVREDELVSLERDGAMLSGIARRVGILVCCCALRSSILESNLLGEGPGGRRLVGASEALQRRIWDSPSFLGAGLCGVVSVDLTVYRGALRAAAAGVCSIRLRSACDFRFPPTKSLCNVVWKRRTL